ncbi:CU044_5270 family protein [Actinoplanes sp. NPDC000266]
MGNGPDSEAFTTISDLLGESYPPAALYPALYRAAAKIPGVLVVDDAVDAAGRHGVALARVDESGLRQELIFDKSDYTYLGTRMVRTTDDPEGIKAGTVTYSSAILSRALVGAMKQTG